MKLKFYLIYLKKYIIGLAIFSAIAAILGGVVFGIIYIINARLSVNELLVSPAGDAVTVNLPATYNQPLILTLADLAFSITPLGAQAAAAAVENNVVKYIDAFTNTDIVQTKYSNKIKEDIILKKSGHPAAFAYQLDLAAYDFKKDGAGNLLFYQKGRLGDNFYLRFSIPAPFMIDANGKQSSTKEVTFDLRNDGRLTISPNAKWLAGAKYPVILDPTIEIIIINVHSSPQQGENWIVNFTTQGAADLKIIPNAQATIDDDEFVSLSCGNETRQPQILAGDVIYYPGWECSGTGQVVHYTKKAGNHTLRFEFGGQVVYAYNSSADSNIVFRKNVIFRAGCSAIITCGQSCVFDGLTYGTVTADDGKCWLDRNLGATQAAVSSTDTNAYGYYYQWGRLTDGHQIPTSGTTVTQSSGDVPGHANFIKGSADWRSTKNDNLWQGVNGINNPCSTGWRLPTSAEWSTLVTAEGITNIATAYSSSLKLTVAGIRGYLDTFSDQGSFGYYWSSSPDTINAFNLYFSDVIVNASNDHQRASGMPVRCVRDVYASTTPKPIIFRAPSIPVAPNNTVAPAVTGTAEVGQTLSCSTGTWTGSPTPTYTYQWQHTTTNISGATNSTYVIESAYIGETIRCVVMATNSVGNASANSNNSGIVAGLYRYWRLLATAPGSDAAGISMSELKLNYDATSNSLVGKTITNLGSSFSPTYPLSELNDGVAETVNGVSIAYMENNPGTFDIKIDLGAGVTENVTAFEIAPQGTVDSISYHNPLNLTFYYSSDGTSWTAAPTSYSGISSGYPNWNPGTYRSFSTGL